MPVLSLYKSSDGEKQVLERYENTLKKWSVSWTAQSVSTRHGETFIIECGNKSAPPLLMIHGASSNSTFWGGDIQEYCKHFRVYAVDVPGEPGKSSSHRASYQNLDYSEWIEDVLNHLNIQEVNLFGLSQGGWIAIRFSASHPNRVKKLVLLAPAGVVPTKFSFILRVILYSLTGKSGVQRINRWVFGKQNVNPDAFEFMNLIMTHFKPRLEKEYIFRDDELKNLSMPVLVIGGTEDVIRSSSDLESRLKSLVPQLKSHILPEMGHVLINVTHLIIPFLGAY